MKYSIVDIWDRTSETFIVLGWKTTSPPAHSENVAIDRGSGYEYFPVDSVTKWVPGNKITVTISIPPPPPPGKG